MSPIHRILDHLLLVSLPTIIWLFEGVFYLYYQYLRLQPISTVELVKFQIHQLKSYNLKPKEIFLATSIRKQMVDKKNFFPLCNKGWMSIIFTIQPKTSEILYSVVNNTPLSFSQLQRMTNIDYDYMKIRYNIYSYKSSMHSDYNTYW